MYRQIIATLSPVALAFVAATSVADPVPPPDPHILGYTFPESEATILGWVNNPTPKNFHNIALHGWGIWASITSPSSQTEFGIPNAPVYLTWLTPQEVAALPTGAVQTPMVLKANGPRLLQLEIPRQFKRIHGAQPEANAVAPSGHGPMSVRDNGILETEGYDPAAAAFAQQNNLFSLAHLKSIYDAGNTSIPPFPIEAIATKPVYKIVSSQHYLPGTSIYVMPAWPGTPNPAKAEPNGYPEKAWPGCVYIDTKMTGPSTASGIDATCVGAPNKSNTYSLADFIAYPVTDANKSSIQALTGEHPVSAGDTVILMGMHVTSREISEWTWQTYFWTPNPKRPPLPSDLKVATARPPQVKGAAAHYAMSIAYQMVAPNQPPSDGKSVGSPVIVYNPYLEAGFGNNTFTPPPDNPGIFNPKTKKTFVGNLGKLCKSPAQCG